MGARRCALRLSGGGLEAPPANAPSPPPPDHTPKLRRGSVVGGAECCGRVGQRGRARLGRGAVGRDANGAEDGGRRRGRRWYAAGLRGGRWPLKGNII